MAASARRIRMKRWLTIVAAVVLGLAVAAGAACGGSSESELTLQPPDPAKLGTTDYDIIYGNVDGVSLKMDVYYPEVADKAVPVILYVHGGAWISGDKSNGEGAEFIPELAARGYIVAAVNYRLAPEYKFPAQIEDVKCAVRHLRANAAKYGIDPSLIGAVGASAGGHLVALLGTSDPSSGLEGSCGYLDESSRVQAVADLCGPTDLAVLLFDVDYVSWVEQYYDTAAEQVLGTRDPNAEIVSKLSPVTYVTSDDPPFLIIHGDEDILVPLSQAEILYNQLVAAQVSATLVVVQNASHYLTGTDVSMTLEEIVDMIADFFDQHLK
jgi:acetyl esterase/lipase